MDRRSREEGDDGGDAGGNGSLGYGLSGSQSRRQMKVRWVLGRSIQGFASQRRMELLSSHVLARPRPHLSFDWAIEINDLLLGLEELVLPTAKIRIGLVPFVSLYQCHDCSWWNWSATWSLG